jgi:dolichyl-phosphate-mannose-protein mannosyltransferase
LAVLASSAETLKLSRARLRPRFDEVDYLALARDFSREGGVVPTIRCYQEGRCREDNRPPLFDLLLEPIVDDTPRAFANVKLVNHGTGLLLWTIVFFVTRRVFSPRVAVGTAIALSCMPLFPELSSRVLSDLLFAALTFAFVYAVASWQERGALTWLGIGALGGLAFLAKGSGHLLLVPAALTAVYRYRGGVFRRPILYAGALGFSLAAFFLLWRNVKLWGSPFYNMNAPLVWMEKWRDYWVIRRSPTWDQLGLRWYLKDHSVLQLLAKLARGFALSVGNFVYSAGLGSANVVVRSIVGLPMLALAALGLRRRWAAGDRILVLAVATTFLLYFAALSLAASGGLGPEPRYALPYVVLILPFGVSELLESVWPRLRRWLSRRIPRFPSSGFALGVVVALLLGRLLWAAPAAAADPRSAYAIDPLWHEAAVWLSQSLEHGEQFASSAESKFSTWDVPRPDTDPRWNFWFGAPGVDPLVFLQKARIRKVLVDMTVVDDFAGKLSREADAHGPLGFMGWPRCFADSATPSRILIYCRPELGGRPSDRARHWLAAARRAKVTVLKEQQGAT